MAIAPVLQGLSARIPVGVVRWLGNLWLPFLGAGIKVVDVSRDLKFIRVVLKRSWFNQNWVGTQFGGSIYAMTDPFLMIMIMHHLGKGYVVWDKGAAINFIKPGRSQLSAEFKIDDGTLATIRERTASGEKYVFDLPVEVRNSEGEIVAKVTKSIYVRAKPA